MTGPWDDYATASAPWEDYTPTKMASSPDADQIKGGGDEPVRYEGGPGAGDVLKEPLRLANELVMWPVNAIKNTGDRIGAFTGTLAGGGSFDQAVTEARNAPQPWHGLADPSTTMRTVGEKVFTPALEGVKEATGSDLVPLALEQAFDVAGVKLAAKGVRKGFKALDNINNPSLDVVKKRIYRLDMDIESDAFRFAKPTNKDRYVTPDKRKMWVEDVKAAGKDTITKAKEGRLDFFDEKGDVVNNRAPKSLFEESQVIDSSLKEIGAKIGELTNSSVKVDMVPVLKTLDALANDGVIQRNSPQLVSHIKQLAERTRQGQLTVAEAQAELAYHNNIRFGKHVDPLGPNMVLVSNELAKVYTDAITRAVEALPEGGQLGAVKSQYRAYKAKQNGVNHRYAQHMAKRTSTPVSMWEGGAIYQGATGVMRLMGGDPGGVRTLGQAATLHAINLWNRYQRSPDKAVNSHYKNIEKVMELEKRLPAVEPPPESMTMPPRPPMVPDPSTGMMGRADQLGPTGTPRMGYNPTVTPMSFTAQTTGVRNPVDVSTPPVPMSATAQATGIRRPVDVSTPPIPMSETAQLGPGVAPKRIEMPPEPLPMSATAQTTGTRNPVDVSNPTPETYFDPTVGARTLKNPTNNPPIEPVVRDRTPVNNASGESAASVEAMSVERSRKAAGTKIMIEDSRSGKRRPAVGLRPEDNALNPYDRVIQIDATGKETVLNQGSKVRTYDVTSVVQMLKDQIKAEGGGKAGVAKVALKYGVPAAGLTTFLLADDDQREQMAPMLATVFGGKAMSARRGDVKMGESKVGWFSDRNASVNDGVIRTMRSDLRGKPETGGAKLSDLITHPKLFSEYPWVKEIPVVFKSMAKGNMEAQAIINRGNIMDSRIEVYSANRKTPREILRDLGHEWQHLIDEYENFKHGELNAKATGNDIMTSATNPGRTQ